MKMLFYEKVAEPGRLPAGSDDGKGGGEEGRTEFGVEPGTKLVASLFRIREGKNGTAAAAHQGVDDFGLGLEPFFHGG